MEVNGDWNSLWRFCVPPKVTDFLWRLCRNCLPTRGNLYQKRAVDHKWCAIYGQFEETSWHLFVDCNYAKECWEQTHLYHKLDSLIYQVDGLHELVFTFLNSEQKPTVEIFVMVLWQLWKEMSARVWDSGSQSPAQTVFASAVYFNEWSAARTQATKFAGPPDASLVAARCRAWHRPYAGKLKINVDASFYANPNLTGIGMVIRDEEGTFILAKTLMKEGCVDVEEGEAMGFLEALSWVMDLGLEDVMIEGDCKIVVNAINTLTMEYSTSVLGDYVRACKYILRHCPTYSVHFVRRDANRLAHEFARVARDYGNLYCWLDPPAFVDELIDLPCVCNNEN